MRSLCSIIVVAICSAAIGGAASAARAETSVTIIGTSPLAACAAAAAEAKRTGIGTRFELDTCDRAIETWPAPQANVAVAYINRSVVHIARGESAAAIADANRAIRLNAALGEAYLDRAIALSADHRPAEAIRDFERAIELNVHQLELAYFDRAIALEDCGDIKGAYLDYRRAAELNPAWDKPRQELARFTVVRDTTS
jgi:tetratricopeptide (TPR) repeat protein